MTRGSSLCISGASPWSNTLLKIFRRSLKIHPWTSSPLVLHTLLCIRHPAMGWGFPHWNPSQESWNSVLNLLVGGPRAAPPDLRKTDNAVSSAPPALPCFYSRYNCATRYTSYQIWITLAFSSSSLWSLLHPWPDISISLGIHPSHHHCPGRSGPPHSCLTRLPALGRCSSSTRCSLSKTTIWKVDYSVSKLSLTPYFSKRLYRDIIYIQ